MIFIDTTTMGIGMKLTDLISEKVLIDKTLQNEIDKLGELTNQIEKLKKQLQPLQKKYGDIVESVIPIVEKLNTETIKSNHYVMKIIRKGFERETFSYKEGFLNGISKVNENTKKILMGILEETKKLTKIKPSFSLSPIGEGVGDKLKQWYKRIKMFMKKISRNFKEIQNGNKMLKRLV